MLRFHVTKFDQRFVRNDDREIQRSPNFVHTTLFPLHFVRAFLFRPTGQKVAARDPRACGRGGRSQLRGWAMGRGRTGRESSMPNTGLTARRGRRRGRQTLAYNTAWRRRHGHRGLSGPRGRRRGHWAHGWLRRRCRRNIWHRQRPTRSDSCAQRRWRDHRSGRSQGELHTAWISETWSGCGRHFRVILFKVAALESGTIFQPKKLREFDFCDPHLKFHSVIGIQVSYHLTC